MELDIMYLLFLQGLREVTGGIFNELFNAISKLAVDILPFLPYVIFWCADKRWGWRFMTTLWSGEVVNGVVKLTVCAYRPWIRSNLIEPAGDSKVAATGYSFPSGHTMCATTTYGNVVAWQKDRRRWLAVLCGIMILLTGFSRNFLGVHTPQDVLIGFGESVLLIWIIGKAERKVAGNDKLLDILTFIGGLIIIAALAYIQLKPYPMDYVDGKLLVDPQKMMNDTFKACGGFLGLLIGSWADRHYLHYEIPKGSPQLGVLSCVGLGLMLAWDMFFSKATIILALGGHWGNLLARLIMVLFAIVIWPMVIRKECSSAAKTEGRSGAGDSHK